MYIYIYSYIYIYILYMYYICCNTKHVKPMYKSNDNRIRPFLEIMLKPVSGVAPREMIPTLNSLIIGVI